MAIDYTYIARPRTVAKTPIDPIVARLFSFTHLEDGWDYGRGKPIGLDVIIGAVISVAGFKSFGATEMEAFPRNNGGVMTTAYQGEHTVEIYLEPDGRATLVVDEGTREIVSEVFATVYDAIAKVGEQGWLAKPISDSSILDTILVWSSNVSNLQHLKIPMMMAESQSYMNNVFMVQGNISATTLPSTMIPTSAGLLQYSGALRRKYYPMDAE